MKRSSVVAGVLLFTGLFAAIGGLTLYKRAQIQRSAAQGGYEPADSIDIAQATEMPWQRTADLVGTVFALRSVMVRNELAGSVTTVGFDSGTIVEKGQVILALDDSIDKADLEAAKANVRVAEANITQVDTKIDLATRELERVKTAVAGRGAIEAELDRATSAIETSRAERTRWVAEVDQAKAKVTQLEARIAKMTMHAPFRARAGMRMIQEGQYIKEGEDVVALQELTDTIYLDFAIPQEYAPRVKPGTAVMATGELLGPDPVRIEVAAVDATVNDGTRNLRVRALVDNKLGTLVPGMFIQIRVPVDAPKSYVVVPGTAVRRASYADSVFIVGPDKTAPDKLRSTQRFVKLGPTIDDKIIVLEGIKPGERVAATGAFKLHDGGLVMPAPPSTPGASGASGAPAASAPAENSTLQAGSK